MTYPQYPAQGGYQAMPAPVMPPPGLPQASGATAIIAGVLAILGGLVALIGVVGGIIASVAFSEMQDQVQSYDSYATSSSSFPGWFAGYLLAMSVVQAGVAILLLVGAVMLFVKKAAGRWMVAAGCVLVILSGVIGFMATMSLTGDLPDGGGITIMSGGFGLVILVFPIATLVLALLPATARWCSQAKQQPMVPAYGQPGGFTPPSGGFGQQPPSW